MLKVSIEKPKFEVVEEVRNLLKKEGRGKKEKVTPWTHKERVLVAIIILLTILASTYFWYRGSGKLPQLSLPGFSNPFGAKTIIIDKEGGVFEYSGEPKEDY